MRNEPGYCLQNAISELLKTSVSVPEWMLTDDLPELCNSLNLKMLKSRQTVSDREAVVIYQLDHEECHAEYIKSLREIDWEANVAAVIVK